MLTLTCPIETPLHRWPAGVKLGGLLVATVGLMAIKTPLAMALACAVVAAAYLACGMAFARHGGRLLWGLWPFVAVLVIWHGISGDLATGAVIIGRMLAAVALANLVTMTTRLDALLAVMERLLAPLAIIGLRPKVVALAVALVIRFTPVLLDKLHLLVQAWRARSQRRPNARLVLPAVLVALDDAGHVADALRARGGLDGLETRP